MSEIELEWSSHSAYIKITAITATKAVVGAAAIA